MKFVTVALLAMVCMLLTSCGNESANVSEDNPAQTTVPQIKQNVSPAPKEVRVIFNIQADYPAGPVSPDVVFMDDKPFTNGDKTWTGSHTFVIEKKGYQKQIKMIQVNDPEGDGIFPLDTILNAKERLVLFNITDKNTGKPISPEQVTLASKDVEEEGKLISHQSYVKAGMKKLVIQKKGYQSISDDLNIKPDEEPFVIQYQMSPVN